MKEEKSKGSRNKAKMKTIFLTFLLLVGGVFLHAQRMPDWAVGTWIDLMIQKLVDMTLLFGVKIQMNVIL